MLPTSDVLTLVKSSDVLVTNCLSYDEHIMANVAPQCFWLTLVVGYCHYGNAAEWRSWGVQPKP
jgi:hypothetical protein